MQKHIIWIFLTLLCLGCYSKLTRTISVEAQYEKEVAPNKAILSLRLSEYYREELDPAIKPENYRHRGPSLNELEALALKNLTEAGMPDGALTVVASGTRYKERGRDILSYRRYHITLTNLDLIAPLLSSLNGPEVQEFQLDELKHTDLDNLKNMAVQKALDKAYVQAKTILKGHARLGRLLSVQQGNATLYMAQNDTIARAPKMAMVNAAAPRQAVDLTYKTITVSATVQATFEIK